ILPPEDDDDDTPPPPPQPPPPDTGNASFTHSPPKKPGEPGSLGATPSKSGRKDSQVQKRTRFPRGVREPGSKHNLATLNVSKATSSEEGTRLEAFLGGLYGNVPLSSAQAPFVVPTHPGRVVALDLETFYPWGPEYPQADTEKQLSRRRKLGKGHSFA